MWPKRKEPVVDTYENLDTKSYLEMAEFGEKALEEQPLLGIETSVDANGVSPELLHLLMEMHQPRSRLYENRYRIGAAAAAVVGAGVFGWNTFTDQTPDSVQADSVYLFAPRDVGEHPQGIDGALKYTLRGDTVEVGVPQQGQGRALYIDVEAVPTEAYDLTEASRETPGSRVRTESLFAGSMQAGTDVAAVNCQNELQVLLSTVRQNADVFATDGFSTEAISDSSFVTHALDYVPYTDTPLPETRRNEIIFEVERNGRSSQLVCPPTSTQLGQFGNG